MMFFFDMYTCHYCYYYALDREPLYKYAYYSFSTFKDLSPRRENTLLQLLLNLFPRITPNPIRRHPRLIIPIHKKLHRNAQIKRNLYNSTSLELPSNIRIPQEKIRTLEYIA